MLSARLLLRQRQRVTESGSRGAVAQVELQAAPECVARVMLAGSARATWTFRPPRFGSALVWWRRACVRLVIILMRPAGLQAARER